MSIRSRLLIAIASLTAVIVTLIGLGIYGASSMLVVVNSVVDNEVIALQHLKQVSDAFAVSIVDNAHKVRNGAVDWDAALKVVDDSEAVITKEWKAFEGTDLTAEEAALAKTVDQTIADAGPMLDSFKTVLQAHDQVGLVNLIETQLYQRIDPITGSIDQLISIQDDLAHAEEAGANDMHRAVFIAQAALAVISLIVLGFSGYVIIRAVSSRLGTMQRALADVAGGKLDTRIPFADRKDEIGRIAVAAEVFRENGLKIQRMTDAERAAQAERTAARTAMMSELSIAFGTVVEASVAGDFSSRVPTTFADEELNSLARNVNELVSVVERGLGETEEVLSAIAKTDLTKRMTGDYQGAFARLRDDVNEVADNLSQVIGQLRSTSNGVKMATAEILAGANDLSERTTKQAATIEETSAAMEQLSSTVAANAKNANSASQKAVVAATAAEEGGDVMRHATDAMERISTSSAKISNIIGLIDDIAFQTNLLALNASVEAARAGEAGKGFAVVAVEVRRLAQSAANASSEVKVLIQQSGDEVRAGSSLVAEAAGKLRTMLDLVRESAKSMESIAYASNEQASAISEINTAVRQMDEMTQHNAALVEETNAAIEQTETQAGDLDRIVATFKVGRETGAEIVPAARVVAKRATAANAKRYLSEGNAAIEREWSEF